MNINRDIKKKILIDSRIDNFYKATKLYHQNYKRKSPKKFSSPNKVCDIKSCNNKQLTLSPWIIKKPLGNKPNCDCKFQRRKRRHILSPKKGASLCDPLFRGATIWFDTKWKGNESQLVLTSFFTKRYTSSRPTKHRKHSTEEWKSSSDDEDIELHVDQCSYLRNNLTMEKSCKSCHTSRTPLWRDAEDGTPLCNACGIRYRKYKRRCSQCWNIPKKGKTWYTFCTKCGCPLTYNNRSLSRIITSK